ncbi:MAG: tetratricopeptide repeat-containing sensor histidine kinase [Saprospiraceae bacterium]|nr:tetratricopeptide repeat-containing sensor histidine kinase [Saprospiraceae bacterium]
MRKNLLLFILLLIFSTTFSQSKQKSSSDRLYKIHKRIVDHEKNIGIDTAFYNLLDSFKIELDNYTEKYGYDDVYHNIAFYWGQKYAAINPLTSIDFLKKNIIFAIKDENFYAIAINQHELGKIYFNLQQIDKAISSYLETSEMFLKLEDWPAYAYSIIDIANVYFYKGQFEIASSYYDEAFDIFKNKLNKEDFYYGAALCYLNKGLINDRQENYESALENYRIALAFRKKNKKENLYSSVYQSIANAFERLNNKDSALYYYNLAVKSDEKYQMIDELFYSYIELGDFYKRNKELNKSKEFYIKAYNLSLKNNQVIYQAAITSTLGDFYLNIDQIDSAIYYFEKSYFISLKHKIMIYNKKSSENLYNIYSKTANTNAQLKYLKRLFEIEQLDNTDNTSKMQVQYEFNERIKEKELMELKSQRQRIFIISISVMALLLASIAFMFFRQRVRLKKINSQLEIKNKKIESQTRDYELINIKLKKLDEFKEGLTGIIVHDLKNPINSILHLTELLDEKDENRILIKNLANQILNMVHNILDVQKYENLKMPIELGTCRIKEITANLIKQEEYLSTEKNLILKNEIPDNLIIEADCEKLSRVFINLITNAIKFTPKNGTITIGYNCESEDACFFVKDTGIGIDKRFQKDIFNKFIQVIAEKSGKALSTGLGLTYCKMAIEAHGGKIWLESEVDKGSTFFFTLPKAL